MARTGRETIIDLHVSERMAREVQELALATGHSQAEQLQDGSIAEKPELASLSEDVFRTYSWIVREQAEGRVVISLGKPTFDFLASLKSVPGGAARRVAELVPEPFRARARRFFKREL